MSNQDIVYKDCLTALGIQWDALRAESIRLVDAADKVADLYPVEDVRALLLCAEKLDSYRVVALLMGEDSINKRLDPVVHMMREVGAQLCWAKGLLPDNLPGEDE